MNRILRVSAAAVVATIWFAGVGCAANVDEPGTVDDEAVGTAEEALHEQACLDGIDASATLYDPGLTCGGSWSSTLSSSGTNYGTTDCNNQFRARWTIDNDYKATKPFVQWNGVRSPRRALAASPS